MHEAEKQPKPSGLRSVRPIHAKPTASSVVANPNGLRILVVDDDADLRRMLALVLAKHGHRCVESETADEALSLAVNGDFDVILTDLCMPGMSGIELLRRVKEADPDLPVIMISGQQDIDDAIAAMNLGADDYITKPPLPEAIQISIDRAVSRRHLKLQVRAYQERLEAMVAERTSQIQRLFMNVIQSLIHTLEAKDPYTNGHSKRVAWLTCQLGRAAGLSEQDLEILQLAAVLHDLGKIGIRESVLQKSGRLTAEEYEHIKLHSSLGIRILEPLQELKVLFPFIRHHHERLDGGGYPDGLRGEEIPFGARIISIADAFDAMMSARPYRAALPIEETLTRMRLGSGTQFDPQLLETFLPLAEDKALQEALASPAWTSCGKELDLSALDYTSIFLRQLAV